MNETVESAREVTEEKTNNEKKIKTRPKGRGYLNFIFIKSA